MEICINRNQLSIFTKIPSFTYSLSTENVNLKCFRQEESIMWELEAGWSLQASFPSPPFPCFYVESLKVSVVEWSQEIGSRCFRHFKIPCPNPLRIPSHLSESKLKSPLSLMALQTPLWETPSWEGWV